MLFPVGTVSILCHMEISGANLLQQARNALNSANAPAQDRDIIKKHAQQLPKERKRAEQATEVQIYLSGRQKTKELSELQTRFTKNQVRLEELKNLSEAGDNKPVPTSFLEKREEVAPMKEGESIEQYKTRLSENLNVLLKEIQKKQNEFENLFALSGIVAPETQVDIEKLQSSNIAGAVKLDNSNVLNLLKDWQSVKSFRTGSTFGGNFA